MGAPRIIGLTGRQEAGKSTAARHLREAHGYAGSNLTDVMDEMLAPLLRRMGVPDHEIAPRLSGTMKNAPIPGFEWLTGRRLKQAMGREFRDAVSRPLDGGGTDRGFFHDLWRAENAEHPLLVHEQVRYEFEARLIQRDGGVVYRIVDPEAKHDDQHESERVDFEVDGEILNPKTGLAPLHAALDAVVGDDIAPVERSAAPLGDLRDGIDAALNEHGPEIRSLADRLDAGDGRLAGALGDALARIRGSATIAAAAGVESADAAHARAAVASWFTAEIDLSTEDRRIAAVYAGLGADAARRALGDAA